MQNIWKNNLLNSRWEIPLLLCFCENSTRCQWLCKVKRIQQKAAACQFYISLPYHPHKDGPRQSTALCADFHSSLNPSTLPHKLLHTHLCVSSFMKQKLSVFLCGCKRKLLQKDCYYGNKLPSIVSNSALGKCSLSLKRCSFPLCRGQNQLFL